MKGILLAGGRGSRLDPLTRVISKQLLPVYDKPLVYYPLSTLMLAGLREILVISTPEHLPLHRALLGEGDRFGISLSYAVQARPGGIAEAFVVGEEFIGGDPCCLILGDNILYGNELGSLVRSAAGLDEGALIFAHRVRDPSRFGVVRFGADGQALELVEKPPKPPSPYAVPGIYFYDADVVERARALPRSSRGELEITELNRTYLDDGRLRVERFGRGMAWFDTGTQESLLEAGNFIRMVQRRQGLQIGCPEELALLNGWLTPASLRHAVAEMGSSPYTDYLRELARGDER
jgi:glucose-1-phosphate thymidylyltransferase